MDRATVTGTIYNEVRIPRKEPRDMLHKKILGNFPKPEVRYWVQV